MFVCFNLILGGSMFGTLVGSRHAPSAAGSDQNCFEICQKMQITAAIKAHRISLTNLPHNCFTFYFLPNPTSVILSPGTEIQILCDLQNNPHIYPT